MSAHPQELQQSPQTTVHSEKIVLFKSSIIITMLQGKLKSPYPPLFPKPCDRSGYSSTEMW